MTRNGVIELVSGFGYLLRVGFTDFTDSLNPVIEEQHADVPDEFYCLNDPYNPTSSHVTAWIDNGWTLVIRPL